MVPRKRLSLDTNLLIDLAEGIEFAVEFRGVFQERGYELVIVPRVAIELVLLADGADARLRKLARIAAERLLAWKVQVLNLNDAHSAIALEFGKRLVRQDMIPPTELSDGIILGESALLRLPLLVSSDHHLLGIDEPALRIAFDDADLPAAIPVSPRRLLRALRA